MFSGFQEFEGKNKHTWLRAVPAFAQLTLNGALEGQVSLYSRDGSQKK